MKNLILSVIVLAGTTLAQMSMAAVANSGNYAVDKTHTNIGFKVSHMGISLVVGRFNTFDGQFNFEPNGESSVSIDVEIASVDTNNARRDRHLRSADFFDASRFPNMTFRSSNVTYDAEGNPSTITGALSFHGVENTVTFEVAPVGAAVDQLGS